ncbi:uncharacterized protein [Montipora foliosa]|uniref:uncharacterized protein n=1 Tax=Montipora foliosa TaxID=591990 RepID=UPI0035F1C552
MKSSLDGRIHNSPFTNVNVRSKGVERNRDFQTSHISFGSSKREARWKGVSFMSSMKESIFGDYFWISFGRIMLMKSIDKTAVRNTNMEDLHLSYSSCLQLEQIISSRR